MDIATECAVCLSSAQQRQRIQLSCKHSFCESCVKNYIETLRSYHLLTPEKLKCLNESCQQEIQDSVITKLFPGQLGFILNIVKKRYRQSKDPNIVIFDCKGKMSLDRKALVPKSQQPEKQKHGRLNTNLTLNILSGKSQVEYSKGCTNIISFNKSIPRKQSYVQCIICCCLYCIKCFNFIHDGACLRPQQKDSQHKIGVIDKITKNQNEVERDMTNFVERNGILICLNEKCQVPIAKEEGCFWIKCRCSWQMCYPCKKLWGNCEHFKNYPYKPFVPPPQWMVKALNLF